jgi:iron complex outermembrane receptor protein
LKSDHGSQNVGLYAQGEVAFLENLRLNAGVRYDYYDTFGGTVNPRCGLIFAPLPQSTFKFLYGRAFRAPNEFELYYESITAQSNPNLDPEMLRTDEWVKGKP